MQIVHYKLYLTFNLHVVSPPDREMPKKTILGGLEVEHARSAPFHCKVDFRNDACGCAIISDEWILTSGHCAQLVFTQFLSKMNILMNLILQIYTWDVHDRSRYN